MPMQDRRFDDVVVGQGLAGTTLAWQLRRSGRSVLIIDRDAAVSSSSVAAGLMTPVTGQRLVRTWRWDELWPAACRFYERVEQETGTAFFIRLSMVRLFADRAERELFESRRSELGELVRNSDSLVDPTCFHDRYGGFEMPEAGCLNVPKYLHASRSHFISSGCYLTARIDSSDVVPGEIEVAVPRLGIRAQRLTWCQGIDGEQNPQFSSVGFNPAKGEVLRVRVPGLAERRVVHGGVWLLPLGDLHFLAGATFDWESPDGVPTPAGRSEIVERLRRLLRLPFQIVGHAAGVRPALHDLRPVLGVHPQHGQLAIFNGLGSKGALSAPGLARQLVRCIHEGVAVDPEVSCRRWNCSGVPANPPRLTDLAHQLVRSRLRPGEFAVDATAGNGRDTAFLARTVGHKGRVIAFDIQETALQRTSDRLRESDLGNVTLIHADHASLSDALPLRMRGRIGAVMFNLGYLPGGDRAVITRPSSTILALQSALKELRPGGIATVLAYPGHGGGAEEALGVEELLAQLPGREWEFGRSAQDHGNPEVPKLFWAVRRERLTPVHTGCPAPQG